MAFLTIPDQNTVLHDAAEIRQFLNARGVIYEQWEAAVPLADDADQDTILNAYAYKLKPYMEANGYQTADVINVHPETPNLEALRNKFLTEHTHTEDEVRFFVDGEGMFWFNLGGEEAVFCVTCQAGDLLSVPANTRHWFDLGPKNRVKAIRVFIDQSGWVPHYTESGVDAEYNGRVPLTNA
ncbi:MAG TPA: cupin domain-containing protein [Saprospiraceae bacterium]|mgnify:FL=1|nr:cupin domain-containing protein [Saprospiraceae bacterium]HMP25687.1 cupin domain-containing protein [Saprospiraceae bacterium]